MKKLSKNIIAKIRENPDKVDWRALQYHYELSEEFIEEFFTRLNRHTIFSKQLLSFDFIKKHCGLDDIITCLYSCDKDNLELLYFLAENASEHYCDFTDDENEEFWTSISSVTFKLTEEFIEKYKMFVDWETISGSQILTECFIEKYKDYIYWDAISSCQELSEEFIEKYENRLNWKKIPTTNFSFKFIEKHIDEININDLVEKRRLPIDFIRKYKDRLNLYRVCGQYINKDLLTKSFIYEFKKYIDWCSVSQLNNLTDDFVMEFFNELKKHYYQLSKNKNISKDIIAEMEIFK